MYTFLFDRRSLALLVSGAVAAGVLLFAAGMLVGLRINLPAAPVRTAEFKSLSAFEGGLIGTATADPATVPAAPPLSAPAASEPAPAPADPAPVAEDPDPAPTATPLAVVPKQAAPTPAPPIEVPTAPPPAPVPLPPEAVAPAPVVAEPARETVVASAEPVPAPTETAVEAAAPPEAVASRAEPASPPEPRHGPYVQVGAFGVSENAEKQLALLVSEGFNGYITEQRTRSGGTLKVVCFGRYPTLKAAFIDAQKYLAVEPGREAVVRSPR